MIVIRLMGGLGNQMFQYAAAKALALKHETTLKIDTSLLDIKPSSPHTIIRDFDLDIFDLNFNYTSLSEALRFNPVSDSKLDLALHKFFKLIKGGTTYIQKGNGFDKQVLSLNDNTCLVGSLQSELYFKDIETTIREDFKFKTRLGVDCFKLAEQIKNVNSVAISIRRTDYITNSHYNNILGFVGLEYYKEAVKIIKSIIDNPVFFIFSDDIEWVNEEFRFIEHTVVTPEYYGEKYKDKLHLMTLCKHHIIPNSTYAWWGAWLSDNPNKIVVGPKRWFKNPSYINNDILPENWLKI